GFLTWFEGAVASGVRQPHALIFQTGAGDDTPVGRPGSSRTSTSTVSTSSHYLPQGSVDRAEPAGGDDVLLAREWLPGAGQQWLSTRSASTSPRANGAHVPAVTAGSTPNSRSTPCSPAGSNSSNLASTATISAPPTTGNARGILGQVITPAGCAPRVGQAPFINGSGRSLAVVHWRYTRTWCCMWITCAYTASSRPEAGCTS